MFSRFISYSFSHSFLFFSSLSMAQISSFFTGRSQQNPAPPRLTPSVATTNLHGLLNLPSSSQTAAPGYGNVFAGHVNLEQQLVPENFIRVSVARRTAPPPGMAAVNTVIAAAGQVSAARATAPPVSIARATAPPLVSVARATAPPPGAAALFGSGAVSKPKATAPPPGHSGQGTSSVARSTCPPSGSEPHWFALTRLPGTSSADQAVELPPLYTTVDSNGEPLWFGEPGFEFITAKEAYEMEEKKKRR
ncbi:unnamed protein product [Caenorhabditis brenneri]